MVKVRVKMKTSFLFFEICVTNSELLMECNFKQNYNNILKSRFIIIVATVAWQSKYEHVAQCKHDYTFTFKS